MKRDVGTPARWKEFVAQVISSACPDDGHIFVEKITMEMIEMYVSVYTLREMIAFAIQHNNASRDVDTVRNDAVKCLLASFRNKNGFNFSNQVASAIAESLVDCAMGHDPVNYSLYTGADKKGVVNPNKKNYQRVCDIIKDMFGNDPEYFILAKTQGDTDTLIRYIITFGEKHTTLDRVRSWVMNDHLAGFSNDLYVLYAVARVIYDIYFDNK